MHVAEAKIELPSVITDNMVLQQNTNANLWGQAKNNANVKVITSWDNNTYNTVSDASGKWKLQVSTPEAGGPYHITISDKDGNLTIDNVMVGEVWLCSGQSNMEMPVKGFKGQYVQGALETISKASASDNIRMLNLKINASQKPLDDCIATGWMESTPENVSNFSATAYYFGKAINEKLNVPVGLICSCWGGSKIESWMDKAVYDEMFPDVSLKCLEMNMDSIKRPKDNPTLLYNAMIHPIQNYTIKGCIWYQGESNLENPEEYKQYFPAMVNSWRKLWNQGEFPFYYVQIAPYDYGRNNASGTEAAEIRQAQLECLSTIPNSGMITTGDIGSRICVHPPYKKQIGSRLALWAFSKTYGIDGIPCCGPIVRNATLDGAKSIISFDHVENGMSSCRDHADPVEGFEIAGPDGIFYPAKAIYTDSRRKLIVSAPEVQEPKEVRYCFHNYAPVNLFSVYGLPASPFRIKVDR